LLLGLASETRAKKKAAREGCDLGRLIEGMAAKVNMTDFEGCKNYQVKSAC
jgi:hypothetical protein